MPRRMRFAEPNHVYHVLNRAAKGLVLFQSPEDYLEFEEVLAEARARSNMRILAYCLMPNHWHLLLWPLARHDLCKFAQWLTSTHAARWNDAHEAVGRGAVYQSRFKSIPIQTDFHLLWVWRYIERNALRAKLVRAAEDWPWGSLSKRSTKSQLDSGPIDLPANWVAWVNSPQSTEEIRQFRRCVTLNKPYGANGWLAQTWRSQGRPNLRKT
jgi:putative transposase